MDDAIPITTRQRRIDELERKNREACQRSLVRIRQYEAGLAAINAAMQNWVDAATAPMRAFAEELKNVRK